MADTDKVVRPRHLSDAQWQEQLDADAAHVRARERGLGILQISSRRYAVVRLNGSGASKPPHRGWYGYLHFRIVAGADNLTWQKARELIAELSARMDADPRYAPELKEWSR